MSSGTLPQPNRVVIPRLATRPQRAAAWMLARSFLGVAATCRMLVRDPFATRGLARAGPVIFAVWHNRLAPGLVLYRRVFGSIAGGRRLAAMVSASRDGAFLAAILEAFAVVPVRGSSSRRGAQALVEMKSHAQNGLHLAITPDGPRGPRYRAQPGVIGLAKTTGLPIVPVSIDLSWCWAAPSWDRFRVPLPFGRWDVELREPMRVSPDADAATIESFRSVLESRLSPGIQSVS